MRILRLEQWLIALGLTSLMGCQLTLTELQALSPMADSMEVPCRPGIISGHVKLMALRPSSGDFVTDEDEDELRKFAPSARVLFEFNDSAPPENAYIMASEYGLSCPNMPTIAPLSSEPIRNEKPCSSEVSQTNGAANPNLVGTVGQAPCDPPKKEPVRVKVCVRPPGVDKKISEWGMIKGGKGNQVTSNAAEFAKNAAQADVIFVFDPDAPPETAYYFTKDPKKLSCPGKPPTKSYDQVTRSGDMPMLSDVTEAREAKEKAEAAKQGNGKGDGKGDGKTTSTSSPDGKGPPLDPFETVARELVFAGKLATGDVSDPATVAEGSRHGAPGGKNVGGFSFPALQMGVGLATIVIGVGMKPKEFIKKVVEKTGIGKPAIVKELNDDALRIADELVQVSGEYVMAESVRKQGLILPFKMAQKFTANLGGKFQAHKIFERRSIKALMKNQNQGMSEAALDKAADEVAGKYPSIILTAEQHTEISNALNAAWKKHGKTNMTTKELRQIYEDVYRKDYPQWLDAIKSYLR